MRRFFRFSIVLVFLVLAGAGLFGTVVYNRVNEPFKGYAGPEQFVQLPPGTPVADIGRRLVSTGVVRDELTFRIAVWLARAGRRLRAGEYRFDEPLNAAQVVDRITRGDVYVRLITLPEGLAIREMAKIFESKGFGAAQAFVRAASDVSAIADIDPKAADLEGYLFPDTYGLARGTSASALVKLMVERFRKNVGVALQQARNQGVSVREVVTLASLVEKETARPEERPIVAAVYRNRLRIGMAMQADPTIIYALEKTGRYSGNIRKDDLQLDSPYNTYRYPGLPPGPICSPGRASIEAALNPAAAEYLYFVSRNDGSHVFAKTLDEHNRNVRQFQILYFRAKRLQERRRGL